MELLPAADEDRHGEKNNVKNNKDPLDSKPRASLVEPAAEVHVFQIELEARD